MLYFELLTEVCVCTLGGHSGLTWEVLMVRVAQPDRLMKAMASSMLRAVKAVLGKKADKAKRFARNAVRYDC